MPPSPGAEGPKNELLNQYDQGGAFMIKKIFFLFFIFLFVLAGSAFCEQPDFQETASEMIKSLTQKPTIRPHNFVRTRGFNPSPTCRAIVVKERIENKTVEKTITIYPDQPTPHANLKIEFDVNSYRIRPGAYLLLKELGMAITDEKLQDKSFYINGHTDSDGSWAYNMDLSVNRAQSVKDFLVGNYNIPAYRLKVLGYGEAVPLLDNTTAFNKQINRRVEIKPVN